eukprot:COSAG05_NODE_27617_length_148_cov_413.979592_1_plen_21_part_10
MVLLRERDGLDRHTQRTVGGG